MLEKEVERKTDHTLIDKVIEQMKLDFEAGDCTAIEELLKCVDKDVLRGFLPEE